MSDLNSDDIDFKAIPLTALSKQSRQVTNDWYVELHLT